MQLVKCSTHHDVFRLPVTDEEYVSGKLHDNVESLCKHTKLYGHCKFVEVKE